MVCERYFEKQVLLGASDLILTRSHRPLVHCKADFLPHWERPFSYVALRKDVLKTGLIKEPFRLLSNLIVSQLLHSLKKFLHETTYFF